MERRARLVKLKRYNQLRARPLPEWGEIAQAMLFAVRCRPGRKFRPKLRSMS